ncbi:MAG: carbohydrate kinase family protein [Trinickia sp.]|jgi:fructokinase|uniref:carbohydrate kinase family protein n=1 Tax=Trinickia sp. TaxID=2571163 RepID=UPI003F7D2205
MHTPSDTSTPNPAAGTAGTTNAAPSPFPLFVSAGDILTDLVRTDGARWVSHPGGAGWNVARAVACLGVPTAFAGSIGTDCFSDELYRASDAAGLDLRFLQRVERAPLLAIVHETHPPAYFFIGEASADLAFDPESLPEGWMAAARWAHFGGISLARAPLSATLATLAADLRAQGVKISFDPNYRNLMQHGYRPMLETMASLADLIKVSDEDLRCLFDTDEDTALDELRAMNKEATLLVTRGAGPATLITPGETIAAMPPRVEVVDTVGAGDASIGGLLFSLIQRPERAWRDHLAFALAAGAAACRRAGAHSPTLDEIVALLP